jgi:hypothetical protein
LEEAYERFTAFFDYKDDLTLKIKQNSIYYESEQVYHNPEKEDNLALFFFKDGLRELTFKKAMSQAELEEFLKITALDFDVVVRFGYILDNYTHQLFILSTFRRAFLFLNCHHF